MEIDSQLNLINTGNEVIALSDHSHRDNKLRVELNIGLGLPFKFYSGRGKNKDSSTESTQRKSVVRSVDDNGSVIMLEVATSSTQGPLQAFENDVLNILLTMAYEQKRVNEKKDHQGVRVYFTLAEVCRRLGLSTQVRNRVSKAIDRIQSQKLQIKTFMYNSTTKEAGNIFEKTGIILKSGRYFQKLWISFHATTC